MNLDFFFSCKMLRGCLVCVIFNSKSLHSFNIQTLHNGYSYIEDVHLLFCAHLINIFSFFRFSHFLGLLNLDILSIRNASGVSGLCNL